MANTEVIDTYDNCELRRIDGELIYLINGLTYIEEENNPQEKKFGLFQSDLGKYAQRGQVTAIAQFFTLVINGLIIPKHIFAGLNRPLFTDEDKGADKNKLIQSRKPKNDYVWKNPREVKELHAPDQKVFVIIISKNIKHTARFPMVYGWIDRWNWVDEDKGLAEAPVNWVDRYDRKIYTRP